MNIIFIERLNLEGFLKGVDPLIQQALFAIILFMFAHIIPKEYFLAGFFSIIIGLFFIIDIIISKTIGWESLF